MTTALLFVFAILAPRVSWSAGYEDCSYQKTFMDNRLKNQLVEIAATLEPEEAPFNFACRDRNSTVGRPKTGLFKRDIPEKDAKDNYSYDFLGIIEKKVRNKIAETRNMAKAIKTCKNSKAPNCQEIQKWIEGTLPDFVGTTRFHLSLAQSAHEKKTWIGKTSQNVNESLDSLGSPKMKKWNPASESEKAQATKAFKIYDSQINTQYPEATIKEKEEALLVLRYQHFEQYQTMMSKLPFLQYIKSEKPDAQEIFSAVKELETNIDKEENELDEIAAAIKRNPMDPKALQILRYSTLVEETLLENPNFCAIATSLIFTSENRDLGRDLALALPILAVSIFAPPAAAFLGVAGVTATSVGIGTGMIASTAFIYESQNFLNQEKVRAFSQFYGDETGLELEQVRVAESMRNFEIVTMPLAFGGVGGIAGRHAVLIKRGAINMASKIKILARKP